MCLADLLRLQCLLVWDGVGWMWAVGRPCLVFELPIFIAFMACMSGFSEGCRLLSACEPAVIWWYARDDEPWRQLVLAWLCGLTLSKIMKVTGLSFVRSVHHDSTMYIAICWVNGDIR